MICKAYKHCPSYKKGKCTGIDCSCIALGTDTEDYLRELYDSYGEDDPYEWL